MGSAGARKYMQNSQEIIEFLRAKYQDKPAVIAVSGGVDSALALTLLVKALGVERVTPVLLPYKEQDMSDAKLIVEHCGLTKRAITINIGTIVDEVAKTMSIGADKLRLGNVMARVRMIAVFDTAKKMGSLVCGTENKSEHELGYYTRFGDAASDVEPIAGLYKSEVWEMAKELGLPEIFYTKAPSAGLWEGQSDETEMGFSYYEADKVLKGEIEGIDAKVVERVREVVEANKFKLEVPYMLS